jgi:hypothetical protein
MPESASDAGTESVTEGRQADDDVGLVGLELCCEETGERVDDLERGRVGEEGGDAVVGLGGQLADGEEQVLAIGQRDRTAVFPWWVFLPDFVTCEQSLPVLCCRFCVVGCHVRWG